MNSGQSAGINPYEGQAVAYLPFDYRQQIVDVWTIRFYPEGGGFSG
jgi:hypothetical protein